MPRFTRALHENVDPHRFEVFDFAANRDELIAELSDDIRELYLDAEFDRVLEQAAADLDPVSDPDAIRGLIESATQAAIPEAGRRETQPWLDVARNELAEVICYAALEELHDATVPAKRVRHKEVPGLMSRGMDALALRKDGGLPFGVRILLSETKASSSADSPPSVVGEGADSLHAQLQGAVRTPSRVTSELARAL